MTSHEINYRLANEAEQRRLNELTDCGHESVADLTHEIGMCRFLIKEALITHHCVVLCCPSVSNCVSATS